MSGQLTVPPKAGPGGDARSEPAADLRALLVNHEELVHRLLFALGELCVVVLDRQGICRRVWGDLAFNQRFALPPVPWTGRPLAADWPAADVEPIRNRFATMFAGDGHGQETWNFRTPAGPVWLDATWVPLPDRQGQVAATLLLLRDVTVQRNLESSLRQSEAKFRSLVENANEAISVVRNGKTVYRNPRATQLLDQSTADNGEQTIFDLIAPEDQEKVRDYQRQRQEGRYVAGQFELDLLVGQGRRITVEIKHCPVEYEGEPATLILWNDVSERRRAEHQLRQSIERYRTILDTTHDVIWVQDLEGRLIFINRRGAESFGHQPEHWYGRLLDDLVHPDDVDISRKAIEGALQGKPQTYEIRIFDRQKREIVLLTTKVPRYEDGRIVGSFSFGTDITERKRAEQALATEKELLSVTLRSLREGVITVRADFGITLINPAAEQLTGWSQARAFGRPLLEVLQLHDEQTQQPCLEQDRILSALAHNAGFDSQGLLRHCDGTARLVAYSVTPIQGPEGKASGFVLVLRDITSHRKVEQELRRAQKMETLGLLAGGIAHDFNNILTTVMGSFCLARRHADRPLAVAEDLDRAQKALSQAKSLTLQLLTFAKGGLPLRNPIFIADIVSESAELTLRGGSVLAELSVTSDLWPVEVDPGQLVQVFNNLFLNAQQSMPQGGVVRVQIDNCDITEPLACHGSQLLPGRYVVVEVRDQGVGVAAEWVERIFEPGFTTKPTGSGLGLATVYAVVRRHEGHLRVCSQLGQGTSFFLYLPATHKIPAPTMVDPTQTLSNAGTRLLLLDEEAAVRDVTVAMLRYMGLTVDVVSELPEAYRLCAAASASGQGYAAALLDLSDCADVPGMQIAARLQQLCPGIRVIASGLGRHERPASTPSGVGFAAFLPKPYDIEQLQQVLRQVLS